MQDKSMDMKSKSPDSNLSTGSAEEKTTRYGRSKLLSETRTSMTKVEKILIIVELLVYLSISMTYMLLSDEKVIASIDLEVDNTLFFNHVGYILGILLNVPVGGLSDSLTGKFWVSMVGIGILIVGGVFGIVALLDVLSAGTRQLFFYLVLLCVSASLSTYGVRTSFLFSEISNTSAINKALDYFIFLMWLGRTGMTIFNIVGFLIGSVFNIATIVFACFGVISSVAAIILAFYLKSDFNREIIEKGIVVKCIKLLVRRKSTEKNEEDYHNLIGRRSLKIIIILTSIIGFEISYFVLYNVLATECTVFSENEPYRAKVAAILVFFILEALMLLFLHFSFLNIFRKWNVELIDLRLSGIAYNFMGVAMILLCLGVSGLRLMKVTVEGQTQFRFYNGANQIATLKSDLIETARLAPGELKVIKDIPCVSDCTFQFYIEFQETKENISTALKGEELQSFTFVIGPKEVKRVSRRDPIEQNLKKKAILFIVTNVDSLQALLIFDEEYPVSFRPNLTDHVMLIVPGDLTFNGYRTKSSLVVQNDTRLKLKKEKIYSMFIYIVGNTTSLETSELKLELKSRLNPFLLILPAIIGTFAAALGKLSLYRFIVLEAPPQLLATLTSYLVMVMNIGVITWVLCYTLSSIWIVALAIFTCIHIIFNFGYSKLHGNYIFWKRQEAYNAKEADATAHEDEARGSEAKVRQSTGSNIK